jgi:hypothetical protein
MWHGNQDRVATANDKAESALANLEPVPYLNLKSTIPQRRFCDTYNDLGRL